MARPVPRWSITPTSTRSPSPARPPLGAGSGRRPGGRASAWRWGAVRLAAQAEKARLGPGLGPGTQLGPLVSAEQHERVMGYIEAGRAEGAEGLAGGEAAATDSGG